MKHIITIISALLFIAGSVFLDIFLSESNSDVQVVLVQHTYQPVNAHPSNAKTDSLPFENSNTEKQVEGAHVKNARFAGIRKISLHRNYFDLFLLSGKQPVSLLPSPTKAQPGCIAYTVNNLSLHIRNCIWLI